MQTPGMRPGLGAMVSMSLPWLWGGGSDRREGARHEIEAAAADAESARRAARVEVAQASGRVQALLEQMAALEVTEFPEKQPALVQLVPPQWSVDLYGENGLLTGLRIGRRDPRGGVHVVAQGLGDRAAFLLAPTVLINLPFDLERLGTGEIQVPVDSQRG